MIDPWFVFILWSLKGIIYEHVFTKLQICLKHSFLRKKNQKRNKQKTKQKKTPQKNPKHKKAKNKPKNPIK